MSHYFTNDEIKSNLQKTFVKIKDKNFSFYTDNGVFSKKGLDFGSRTLLESVLEEDISGKVLDVGCGYGALGIILSSFFNVSVDMIDINKRAVHLSSMNIKENDVSNITSFYSNIYENVNKKYDVIITNPPIRAGKDVVYKILFGARDYLVSGGTLYFVINKDQGAKSTMKDIEKISNVEVINKNKGFFVIKCKFN